MSCPSYFCLPLQCVSSAPNEMERIPACRLSQGRTYPPSPKLFFSWISDPVNLCRLCVRVYMTGVCSCRIFASRTVPSTPLSCFPSSPLGPIPLRQPVFAALCRDPACPAGPIRLRHCWCAGPIRRLGVCRLSASVPPHQYRGRHWAANTCFLHSSPFLPTRPLNLMHDSVSPTVDCLAALPNILLLFLHPKIPFIMALLAVPIYLWQCDL